jgi:hypothetical protein
MVLTLVLLPALAGPLGGESAGLAHAAGGGSLWLTPLSESSRPRSSSARSSTTVEATERARPKTSPAPSPQPQAKLRPPYTPGFVGNGELASQLAEVGVILLMFGVGLHFSIGDLMAGPTAMPATR